MLPGTVPDGTPIHLRTRLNILIRDYEHVTQYKILSFGPRDTCRRHLMPGQVPRFVHPGEGGHAHLRRRRADAHRHLRLAQEQRALQRLPHPAARHPGRSGLCRRRQHQHLRLVLALGHTPDRPAARSGLCRPLQGDRQLQLLPRPHRRGGGERDQRHQHREARTVHGRGLRRACALLYRAAQDLLQGL